MNYNRLIVIIINISRLFSYNYNSFEEFIIANCIFVKSRNKATSIKFVRNTCLPRGWQPSPLDSRRIRWPRYALGTMIRGTKRASLHDRTAKMQHREALYTHTHQVSSSFHALWERKHFSPPASPKHPGRFHNFVLAYLRFHPPTCFSSSSFPPFFLPCRSKKGKEGKGSMIDNRFSGEGKERIEKYEWWFNLIIITKRNMNSYKRRFLQIIYQYLRSFSFCYSKRYLQNLHQNLDYSKFKL